MVLGDKASREFLLPKDEVAKLELYDRRTIQRDRPMIHPTCDPPSCFVHSHPGDDDGDDATFDFDCPGCAELLAAPSTTISQVFAIVRLWIPRVQNNFDVLVSEILKRGANVNDRDGQTDLTLLHYAVRSGVGEIAAREKAANVASFLLSRGADVGAICRWTHMTPLHLAAFFDSDRVMKVLLAASRAEDVNGSCLDFDGGTSLHIAASNCSIHAAKCLIDHGANVLTRDLLQRLAIDCVPNESDHGDGDPMLILIPQMRQLLKDAESPSPVKYSKTNGAKNSGKIKSSASTSTLHSRQEPSDVIHDMQGQVILQSLGLNIGDKVTLGGAKTGILRYCGTTEFADGMWAGVELERPIGKNNGSVNGISYFSCQDNFGIFAPVTKVKVLQSNQTGVVGNTRGATPRVRSGQPTPRDGRTPTNLSRRASFGAQDAASTTSQARARSVSATGRRSGSAFSSTATRSSSRTRVDAAASSSPAAAEAAEAPSSARRGEDVPRVGDRVTVAGQRRGTVRFVGETQFAKGLWLGIELDEADGKNDGCVNGVAYFSCGANRGVFAPPNRVHRAARSLSRASSTESINSIGGGGGGGDGGGSRGSGGKSNNWGRRSLGTGSTSATRLSRDRTRVSCGSSLGGSQSSISSLGSTKSFASAKSAASTTASGSGAGKKEAFNKVVKAAEKTKLAKLTEGVNVFYNDQIGVVKFIGNTHFEDGVWLGIELRTPQGKNDGCVGDHRYFTCKPNHGVFVRPSKVTVRGINGAKLLIDASVVKNKAT